MDACFNSERDALESLHSMLVSASKDVRERIEALWTKEEVYFDLTESWLRAVREDPALAVKLHEGELLQAEAPLVRMGRIFQDSSRVSMDEFWREFVKWVGVNFQSEIDSWNEQGRPKLIGEFRHVDMRLSEVETALRAKEDVENESEDFSIKP